MKNINIFCFGFGQVAKSFIKKLKLENFNINLTITSRKKTHVQKFEDINYTSFQFDGVNYDFELIENLKNAKYILVSIPPQNGTDLVIQNFSKIIENCNANWITYLSSTSVYGDHNGKWVDEASKTKPMSPNGVGRLRAEELWFSLYLNNKIALQIFRLSGIYSNERNILVRLKAGNVKIINKKNHFFSRIHVEDIASILFLSLTKFKPGEIYNISDDKPSLSEEVTLYGAKILGLKKPDVIEIEDIDSEMLKSFYKDSKKVCNKKIKSFFNYKLKFSTYVEGLDDIRNKFI